VNGTSLTENCTSNLNSYGKFWLMALWAEASRNSDAAVTGRLRPRDKRPETNYSPFETAGIGRPELGF